jgi:hypothetical protein
MVGEGRLELDRGRFRVPPVSQLPVIRGSSVLYRVTGVDSILSGFLRLRVKLPPVMRDASRPPPSPTEVNPKSNPPLCKPLDLSK